MILIYEISQWIFVFLISVMVLSVIFFMQVPYGKRLVIKFVDWYIRGYYSHDYIHRDMIREEITQRIDEAVRKVNLKRDDEEANKIQALKDIHKIHEDGYVAEIMRLEKNDENVKKMRKKVEELYFKVVRRAKELVLITAENWHEGEKIINDVSASIGRLDTIKATTEGLVAEIEDSRKADYALTWALM